MGRQPKSVTRQAARWSPPAGTAGLLATAGGPTRDKADVGYRRGSAARNCGNCVMIRAAGDGHRCTLVRGPIDPADVCDEWAPPTGKTAAWDSSGSDNHGVYLRFGDWPHDERSYSPAGGYYENGVSVYDLDKHGDPAIDHGLNRGHEHDEHCDDDCYLHEDNPDNDPREEMQGRKARAERARYYGSDDPGDVGHLVRGRMTGTGYDGEPLLKDVRRVGDWIDHRHLFLDQAGAHRLARDPSDDDYEEPEEKPSYGYRNERTAAVVDDDDEDTDDYVTCDQGHSHWGTQGAAGLLVRHRGEDGESRYLLQKRSPHVQHGSTWSTPGGALQHRESPEAGAVREAEEEGMRLPEGLRHSHTFADDHGGWAYHTVVMDAPRQFDPSGGRSWESEGHGWFTPQEMKRLPLHPGFAATFDKIRRSGTVEPRFTVAPERDLPRDFLDAYDNGREDELPQSVRRVPIAKIKWGHQSTLDPFILGEYERGERQGDFLPEALQVGQHYHLNDGHHRVQAAHNQGKKTVQATVFHEPEGGWDYEDSSIHREAASSEGVPQRPKRTPGNAMVYLDVPHGTVQPHGGEEPGHHVTLAYLPRKIGDEDFARVVDRARDAATRHAPMKATISGAMTFPPGAPSTQRRAAVVPVHAPGIHELHQEFREFDRSHYEQYTPHVLRAQLGGHQEDPGPHPEASFPVTHVHVRRGDEVHSFPLTGPNRAEAARSMSRMPKPDYDPAEDLPEGRGVWYRAHDMRYPLDEQHARSAPLSHGYRPFQVSPQWSVGQRGYSAFASPHELSSYLDEMEWKDDPSWRHRSLIAFHGKQVGVGEDGEPLVVPQANQHCCGRVVHTQMPYDEFEGRLWHGDYADEDSHKYHNDQELWKEKNEGHDTERRLKYQYRRSPEQNSERRYREKQERRARQREGATGYTDLKPRSGMIYLDLPPGTVRQVPGGVDDHHITVVYLGSDVSDEAFEEACRRTQAAAASLPPMEGVLRGIDIFPPSSSSNGKVPVFVPAYVGGIGALRRLLEHLSGSEHTDYRPHVTQAYLEEGDSLPAPHPAVPVRFTRVHVKRGDDVVSFPLTGGARGRG